MKIPNSKPPTLYQKNKKRFELINRYQIKTKNMRSLNGLTRSERVFLHALPQIVLNLASPGLIEDIVITKIK